jgi:carbonic anhydrase
MTETDTFLRNNEAYAASFDKGDLPLPPGRKVAVLACMDARLDPARVLGLEEGDAHVIRNAGGVASDDALRSLAISQHLLGTEEIVLIHHTDCGMLTFTDEAFAQKMEAETGTRPEWRTLSFTDLDEDVRKTLERIRESPSSRAPTAFAASCTRSRPDACARSVEPEDRVVRRDPAQLLVR